MPFSASQFYGFLYLKIREIKINSLIFLQDVPLRLMLLLSLLLNTIVWTMSVWLVTRATEEVVALHNNIYFGVTLIGAPAEAYFIPAFGLVVIIGNLIFAYLIKEDDIFWLRLFAASAILVNIFLILGLLAILFINLY